ncbi:helix-turn-helix domain-containing protein [Trabulsiella odontotermitis]|uniref:helix-turn-helix domain-containing protein n=1 Tax=Trabulsiella odontotermitis TaxID=379893 RepID=UPI000675DAEE|nr:XRE family transcriptional regulator [Trabulsiella odontotermitis]KNC92315.1 XRE family transcriptional regulator [Trabulsiella odontotermitis]
MKKNVDCNIRHVTTAETNIFAELGFEESEAKRLQESAEKEVELLLAIKRQLMQEISTWIAENKLRQAEVAVKLNVTRPRVSDVVNLKTSKFTLDTLVMMLSKLGKPVSVTVG